MKKLLSPIPGIVLTGLILVIGFSITGSSPAPKKKLGVTAGGFKTDNLTVTNDATVGNTLTVAGVPTSGIVAGTGKKIPAYIGTLGGASTTIGDSAITDFGPGLTVQVTYEPLDGYGSGSAGGTLGYHFDPQGVSWIDTTVGSGGHGAGTGDVLAIGWVSDGSIQQGELDVRDNHNTYTKSRNIGYFEGTSTYDTTSGPMSAFAVSAVGLSGRSAGANPLTNGGFYADAAGGQFNYGLYCERGDVTINQGALSVNVGPTAVQALSATTVHGTGAATFDSTILAASNIVSGADFKALTGTGNVKFAGELEMFGAGTDLYFYSDQASVGGGNRNINIDASGTGIVRINGNTGSIAHSGTGGLVVYGGNNSSTAQVTLGSNGTVVATGNGNFSGSIVTNDINFQNAGGVAYQYLNTGGNESWMVDAAGTGSIDFNSNTGGVSNSGTGGLRLFAGNNSSTIVWAATNTGKMTLGTTTTAAIFSNAAPTSVSHGSFGTGSTNLAGDVTGIGANTSVVLTYSGTGFTNRSWCQATVNASGTPEFIAVTNSATAPTFSCFNSMTGIAANCVDFSYWCTGQ